MESFKVIPHKYLITILSAFLYDFQCLDCWHFMLQFFSIAKTLKPIGWTKFSVAWTHVANCGVCCQYLKLFHMVKHNLQISLRLFSKTLNTFSVSKHILHSNAHVIHTGKHKWQIQIEKTCHWLNTTTQNWFHLYQMMWHNQYKPV